MTGIIIIGALHLVAYTANAAINWRLRYWQQRLAETRARIDNESLDSSLRWAYIKGYADSTDRRDPEIGIEAIVIEHHTKFGGGS